MFGKAPMLIAQGPMWYIDVGAMSMSRTLDALDDIL